MIHEALISEKKSKNRKVIANNFAKSDVIDYEKLTISGEPMTQEEFVQMIKEAEESPTMTLEQFNERWSLEIQRIKKLIV